jgi:hypothetical protein
MCPVYVVYFAVQVLLSGMLTTFLQRIGLLAAVATLHALGYVIGLLAIKRRERGEGLLEDERDRAIDARATRAAYFVSLTGLIFVGMYLPFTHQGWELVNTALFFIVAGETLRTALVVAAYRRTRLAY